MFSVSGSELIETGVNACEEVGLGPREHLRDSLQIRPAGSAELLLGDIISSARGAEHIATPVPGIAGVRAAGSTINTKDAGGDA